MKKSKIALAHLSHHPGVYQMLDNKGEVIYVGKAKDLKKRVSSYFSNRSKDPKTLSLVEQIHRVDVTITHTENEAVLLECNLIKKFRPRYNVLLRDDKSYPYILISHHPYPRIDVYRGPRKKDGLYFGPYPSALAVRETISLLQKLFGLRTCRDSYFAARSRPCLLYQVNRCSAPCVAHINQVDYATTINLAILFLEGKSNIVIEVLQKQMEAAATALDYERAAALRDQINRLRQIQDKQYVNVNAGNADIIGCARQNGACCIQLLAIRDGQVLGSRSYFPNVPAHSSEEEIISAFITQHYLHEASHIESIPREIIVPSALQENALLENVLAEQAAHKVTLLCPQRGDKKKWLAMASTNARQSLTLQLFTQANTAARTAALQQVLQLAALPQRIECFDISHSMGEATVASCVVFDQNGPVKSGYRRFNINGITPGDDVAAMHQVLSRRFKKHASAEAVIPDIILIDGGKTQLAAAHNALQGLGLTSVLLVGVSKGPARKPGLETLHRLDQPPMHLPPDNHALHFIQQIRDEAHRFAITGHRQRRDKTRRQSTLETIPGIGAERRRNLLRYFGGIQGIAHASLDELMKVKGINRSLAQRLFAALHDTTI